MLNTNKLVLAVLSSAVPSYEKSTGPCCEFQLDATIGNRTDQNVYGTACLQADGSWLVQ